MIKIIKEHNFDGRCDVCGCYFEYEHDDIVRNDVMDGSGNHLIDVKLYVVCPKCGRKVENIWHNGKVKK